MSPETCQLSILLLTLLLKRFFLSFDYCRKTKAKVITKPIATAANNVINQSALKENKPRNRRQKAREKSHALNHKMRFHWLIKTHLTSDWLEYVARYRNEQSGKKTMKLCFSKSVLTCIPFLYSFVNVDGIKSSIRLHNLKKYSTYFVWLSARTSVGDGPMSSKHIFTTAEDGMCICSIFFQAIFNQDGLMRLLARRK